jgi:hypothetical protein
MSTTDTPTAYVSDISLESIAKAISHLSIEGLGEINANTKLFSHWPSSEQWKSYQQKVESTILHKLPSAEKEAIETNLAAIDTDFNGYLQGLVLLSTEENGKEKIAQVANYLYDLLDRCESVQEQIYQPTSPRHCTYPYFAHSLILHLALLKSCTLYENEINESPLVERLLNETTFYISDAERNAYQQRKAEIKQERGGAMSELVYVQDSLSQASLTEWCDVSEKFKEIEAVYEYLRAKVPLEYVQGVPFAQGYEIVEQLIGNSSDAKAGQDVLEGEQKQWTETVETTWKVAQPSAELLLKYAPQDPNQRSLVAARLSEQAEDIIIETTTTLITSVIGALPIPGIGIVADGFGLLLGWITGSIQDDPWKALEYAMKKYTDQAVLEYELSNIKNDLVDTENKFNSFCKARTNFGWKPGDTLSSELKQRLINCYDSIKRIQQFLYHPNKGQKHNTLAYFDRCSTLYVAIMSSVVRCLDTYPIEDEYEPFFHQTYSYLKDAYDSARFQRSQEIRRRNVFSFPGTLDQVDDKKAGIKLTDQWSSIHHHYTIRLERYWYLQDLLPHYYLCQLGIHRMFASHDSLVRIYNQKTGKNLPLLVPTLDSNISKLKGELEKRVAYLGEHGYNGPSKTPGIRYGLYHTTHSFEDLKGPRFYEHSDFTGMCVQLTVGSYPDITKQGISDNSIRAIRVPTHWKVTLYPDKDFKGQPRVLTKSGDTGIGALLPIFGAFLGLTIATSNLPFANQDKTSSIKVEIDFYG